MKPFKFSRKRHEYIKWDKNHTEVRIIPKTAPQKDALPEFDADEITMQGIYANASVITHTELNFLLDFIFIDPSRPAAKMVSRINLPANQAKLLASILKKALSDYEKQFGQIKIKTTD